jgi:hypothetical protein
MPPELLSRAVTRAARLLDIEQSKLADVLGIRAAAALRLVAGAYELQAKHKEWELAALFVCIFRSLDALMGHGDQSHTWLRSRNRALGDTPAELLGSVEGLFRVLHYLDAHRGRV